MFSPSTSWYHSSSPHWHFFTTTGRQNCHLLWHCSFCALSTKTPYFVAGTPRRCLSETLSVTLQEWPLLLSASWGTSVKQCCCSSSLKWLTFSTLFLNFFISYPVHDTVSPGNSMLMWPSVHLLLVINALKCIYAFLSFLSCHSLLRLNPDTGKLGMSYSKFKSKDLSKLGHLILKVILENSRLFQILYILLFQQFVWKHDFIHCPFFVDTF